MLVYFLDGPWESQDSVPGSGRDCKVTAQHLVAESPFSPNQGPATLKGSLSKLPRSRCRTRVGTSPANAAFRQWVFAAPETPNAPPKFRHDPA